MIPEEIKWAIEAVAKYGFGAVVAGLIIYALIKHYLGGHLPEKGKNLATKEDIEQITHLVKGVEHQYNVLIKQMEAKQQLRMAAMDRRLAAHQEAFVMWRKLFANVDLNPTSLIAECQEWWDKNCLYLEPSVRQAFVDSIYAEQLRANLVFNAGSVDAVNEAMDELMTFPKTLFEAIKLPGLSQVEEQVLRSGPEQKKKI